MVDDPCKYVTNDIGTHAVGVVMLRVKAEVDINPCTPPTFQGNSHLFTRVIPGSCLYKALYIHIPGLGCRKPIRPEEVFLLLS